MVPALDRNAQQRFSKFCFGISYVSYKYFIVPRMARVLSVACSFLSVKLLGKVCGFLGKLKQHTDDCKRAGHKKVAPGNPPGVDGAARKRAKICLRLELSPASLSDFVSSAKDERITSTSVSADVGLRMLLCLWFD